MADTTENVLFVKALIAYADRLEELLADDWPYYREQLLGLLESVEGAEAELTEEVDEIIALLLDSAASELARSLLTQALSKTDDLESTSRSVQFQEPDWGEPRSVQLTGASALEDFGVADVAVAMQDLTARLKEPAPEGFAVVPVFYATDREPARKGGYGRRRGELVVGIAAVSIPRDHRVSKLEEPKWWKLQWRWDPRKHVTVLRQAARDRRQFVAELVAALAAAAQPDVLMFVHGYNVTFEGAVRRTAQLAYDLDFQGVPLLYSWPSEERRLRYTVDETNVDWTQPHFAEVLNLVLTEVGGRFVHVIAHSMGNRAVVGVLDGFDPEKLAADAARLQQVVFAAPDVDATKFQRVAAGFGGRAERFTLYASSRDLALKLSKRVHGYPRAGETTEQLVIVEGIDTIDATAVDTSLVGHAYYGDNRSILTDLYSLLRDGNAPPRFGMTSRQADSGSYWMFRP